MGKVNTKIIDPPGARPDLTPNAVTVLQRRYLVKDDKGNCIETPAQMFSRVAKSIAEAERYFGATDQDINNWHRKYYDFLSSLEFLPNSPVLMNAGRPSRMLSACFVLPVEDTLEDIFETIKQTALIQKAGGGTGFSFDKLRPTGDRLASTGGRTSGPITFWRVFSEATNAIQQGAFRRGANMGMMSLEHPDILKFIHAKQNLQMFTNFNVSVKVHDQWMEKMLSNGDEPHVVTNPRNGRRYLIPKNVDINNYGIDDLEPLADEKLSKKTGLSEFYSMGDIWHMLIRCAHRIGDPGLCFIDRINRDNPTPALGRIEATNPCGEQPLLGYEACTLGSINLTKFAAANENKPEIDWDRLAEAVKLAVRFLDNVVEACNYPVQESMRLSHANRKIGLGVMGFADMLYMLGEAYDSQQGVRRGESIMEFINEEARKAGEKLAAERGTFANWEKSVWKQRGRKVRNAAMTCVAPTGTISIIADCSGGIEPNYSLAFVRQILNGTRMVQVNRIFKEVAEKEGFYSKKLENQIKRRGTIQNNRKIPDTFRRIFKCAYDIQPQWHIRMQAAFQRHCDAAVSKTINLSENATVETIDKAYKLAYRRGCKGITIYRQGSRNQEPMCLCR